MPPKATYMTHDRDRSKIEQKQQLWRTKELATALMAPAESSGKVDFGPLSDVDKFPAMRMLLMKADEDNADRPTKKLINQILDREQMERTEYLLHADWTGKRGASFEHVQGRVNNLTYHFMFGLAKGVDGPQYTDGADAFIAIYRNSEQKLDDIIALLPMPYESARPCSVLVRLVYIVEYTRRVVQTEESLSLMEVTNYNGVLDEAYDLMSGHIKAQTKPLLEIALSLSRGMFGVLEALRDRCPHLAQPPDGKLCRDLPLMFHIQLLSQSANAVGPGRQQARPPPHLLAFPPPPARLHHTPSLSTSPLARLGLHSRVSPRDVPMVMCALLRHQILEMAREGRKELELRKKEEAEAKEKVLAHRKKKGKANAGMASDGNRW